MYDTAPSGMTEYLQGSITSIVPGDVIVLQDGGAGHVAIVNTVSAPDGNGTKTISTVSQNTDAVYKDITLNSSGSLTWSGYTVKGVVHDDQNTSSSPPSNPTQLSFNNDTWSDISLLKQRTDGGMDVHVLYGGVGTPFTNSSTLVRSLSGSDGWDWTKVKTATGYFNSDGWEDVAIVHQRTDGGADIHILYGATGTPFTYASTFARSLPASAGWNWSQMKVVAGKFNGDAYSDLGILHQLADGGIGVHVLNGAAGTPFQNASTAVNQLPGTSGWDWTKVKTQTSGSR